MNNKQLQIVTYKKAQKLKKLGFEWKVNGCYFFDGLFEQYDFVENFNCPGREVLEMDCDEPSECFSAPTVALALKWFRDVNGMYGYVFPYNRVDGISFGLDYKGYKKWNFGSYDNAESALLDKFIKLLENGKENN
ncbi:hypothetical protein AGMMS49525_04960 [Bacteroidia bacterium]|nr:hypothetical protein AGMMS49525_04960 [Bacteroidia bacterium]